MFLIAHQGNGNHGYASNTQEAILKTLENAQIAGVEFDIRLTKDKKIVIIHDPIIDFVSTGTGIVSQMTLPQLKQYNFGTKKNPSQIGVLEDVLKKIHTQKMILIEIKTSNLKIIDYLYPILKKYKNLNLLIISFHENILLQLKKKDKTIPCGLLIGYFLNIDHNDTLDVYLYEQSYIGKVPYAVRNFFYTINQLKKVEEIQNKYPNAYIITDHADTFLSSIPPTV